MTDPSDQQQKKPTCYPARHTAYCFHRSWRHIHADHWVLCKFLSTCQERARAETGGADQWVLKRRECSGVVKVNKVTSASLGYPLSVFNKNSTQQINRFNAQVQNVSTLECTSIYTRYTTVQQIRCNVANGSHRRCIWQ